MKVLKPLLTLLFILLSPALTTSPVLARNSFDGAWSVKVVADPGCTDRYDVAIRVEEGAVKYESLLMSALGSGTVSTGGRLTARIARVRIDGKLAERTGSGKWRSPDCTGTWTARRA